MSVHAPPTTAVQAALEVYDAFGVEQYACGTPPTVPKVLAGLLALQEANVHVLLAFTQAACVDELPSLHAVFSHVPPAAVHCVWAVGPATEQ